MGDKHLLYITGMSEPFVIPDDVFDTVRRAVIDGAEARWEDEDGTVTRINCHKLSAARFVPSDRLREETLYRRAKRREEWAAHEKRMATTVGEY